MIMNHVDIEPSKWLEKEMSNTFLLMPIPSIVEDKAIGVIRCATKPNRLLGSTIEAFNHEDLDILSYIAKLISVFIEVSIFHENQKQLLTKMPHEIRASLGNIMSIVEYLELNLPHVLNDSSKLKMFRKKLLDIQEECDLSLLTVNSVSVFEDEIQDYSFELVDIFAEIINKIRKMLNPKALGDRNVKIMYKNACNMPPLFIDKYRMQIVFHNLLINAIKYSYEHDRYSFKYNITVTCRLSPDNHFYIIDISNHGIPIPFDRQEDIFINGIRTLDAINIDPGGKGFGLALARHILVNHRATIEVTNLQNPTTFSIYLPAMLRKQDPSQL